MQKNDLHMDFPSRSENEAFARSAVAVFIAQYFDPTLEEISDVKTAVSEAVTNAIIHGYADREGRVSVDCEAGDAGIEITVTDEGAGIADVAQALQPLYTSRPDLERSGMGFTFMDTFMDSLDVRSEPGKGTSVRMVKNFGKRRPL